MRIRAFPVFFQYFVRPNPMGNFEHLGSFLHAQAAKKAQFYRPALSVKGQPRKVIMQANKNGFYYVLDRVTGQFISGQPFAQVTFYGQVVETILIPDSFM